jgi:predicted esterase
VELERCSHLDDLEAYLFDVLMRGNVANSLRRLGVTLQELQRWLEEGPLRGSDSEQTLVKAAYLGRRPSRYARRLDWGLAEPVTVRGAEFAGARRIVLALHGRGSSADAIAQRAVEILGVTADVCVVAPQAKDGSWYPKRHTESRASHGEDLAEALNECLQTVETIRRHTRAPLALFGFSQGACLAFELFARLPQQFDAVVALSGSAIGGLDEPLQLPNQLPGVPVLMGASERDPWLNEAELQHTAQLLRDKGAQVQCEILPGQEHALHALHRRLAEPLLSGVRAQ